ncbi:MAG: hypothetical protein D3917_12735 [Candidatus Electrothrix sp. AX5]|nr:hypothetical protein [Candidatus Electrothrix sp. AX5]
MVFAASSSAAKRSCCWVSSSCLVFCSASSAVNDYWHLLIQIAEETQADLFPQVKQELSDWLQQQERKGVDSRQRKALNLIERHLAAVRAGKSLRPDDLVSSFLTQSEFL